MSLDRLKELQMLSKSINDQPLHQEISLTYIPEDTVLSGFQKNHESAQKCLTIIQSNNEQILSLNQKYQKATTSNAEKEISQQLDQIMKQNLQMQNNLKEQLTVIEKQVEQSKKSQPDEPETRMKINIQAALSNKTSTVLKEAQDAQLAFKQGLRDKITRQVKYVDNNLSPEQLEDIVNDPQKAAQLLQDKMYGTASAQLQNAVSDIQDKNRDIIKLEQSVNQLYQLMVDMAMLVHHQGEQLDNIELNINDTKNYVEKGEKQLIKAKEEHISARKKMCCMIGIGMIGLVVVVAPILASA